MKTGFHIAGTAYLLQNNTAKKSCFLQYSVPLVNTKNGVVLSSGLDIYNLHLIYD